MADREDCRVVRKVEGKRPTSNSHPSENGGNVTGPILKPANLSDKDAGEVLDRTPLARWGGARAITEAVLYLLAGC